MHTKVVSLPKHEQHCNTRPRESKDELKSECEGSLHNSYKLSPQPSSRKYKPYNTILVDHHLKITNKNEQKIVLPFF